MSMATMTAVCKKCLRAKEVYEFQVGRICKECIPIVVSDLHIKKEDIMEEGLEIGREIEEIESSGYCSYKLWNDQGKERI